MDIAQDIEVSKNSNNTDETVWKLSPHEKSIIKATSYFTLDINTAFT